jgi:hypothetical protein
MIRSMHKTGMVKSRSQSYISFFKTIKLSLLSSFYLIVGIAGLRDDDILLSSFPRSGNTWVRFVVANYISHRYLNGQQVTFPIVDTLMPELGANNLFKKWSFASVPRIVKTHRPYAFMFSKCMKIGVIRDARDVMVSYYNFLTLRDQPIWEGNFHSFIRSKRFGLTRWFEHTNSWAKHWDIILQYENLRKSSVSEFGRLFCWLGISISDAELEEVLSRSTFQSVRKQEEVAPPVRLQSDSRFRFARSGRTMQWPAYFSEGDLEYFRRLQKKYNLHLEV